MFSRKTGQCNTSKRKMSAYVPVVLVHGGAGTHAAISQDAVKRVDVEKGVQASARAGYRALAEGGSALDAVEAAVRYMEDDPTFNAGKGSCLTITSEIEMDASIMDGKTLRAGAVACIKDVRNPITVARLVMEKSDHVIMVGDGASIMAKELGAEMCSLDYLITEKSIGRLKALPAFNPAVRAEFKDRMAQNGDHDTVGAIAQDAFGNVAYATSTGGITAKKVGRCGDSPVPGSGGYADNGIGANSTTGHGESLLKSCLGKHINMLMEQGQSPQKAVETSLKYMLQRTDGTGGAIAINDKADIGIYFTSEGMSWAYVKDQKLHYGIYPGEDKVEAL